MKDKRLLRALVPFPTAMNTFLCTFLLIITAASACKSDERHYKESFEDGTSIEACIPLDAKADDQFPIGYFVNGERHDDVATKTGLAIYSLGLNGFKLETMLPNDFLAKSEEDGLVHYKGAFADHVLAEASSEEPSILFFSYDENITFKIPASDVKLYFRDAEATRANLLKAQGSWKEETLKNLILQVASTEEVVDSPTLEKEVFASEEVSTGEVPTAPEEVHTATVITVA